VPNSPVNNIQVHLKAPLELYLHMRKIIGMHMWLACGPGDPEISKSYSDMACKLFTFCIYM